jgi:integrase/recombinase XerD
VGGGNVNAFSRQTGEVSIGSVTKSNVLRFLDSGQTSDVTWMVKYRILRAFFQYWIARGEIHELPMPRPRAAVGRPTVAPYIYSISDMRRLLWGTCFMQRLASRGIDPATLRVVLMCLSGTGARIDETLALAHGDVDLRNGTATFRRSTRCARTIPIGPSLCQWLWTYSVSDRNDAQSFFARRDGEAIHHQMLLRTFESVRRRADVTRLDGIGRKPLLRELRPTFAVYCLREWIERKKDLRSMLPILAAYLGHVSLSSTEEYLSFAPNRFWKQLSSLSPGRLGPLAAQPVLTRITPSPTIFR